jgi:hypothetical protein
MRRTLLVAVLLAFLPLATVARAEDAGLVFEKGWKEPQVAVSPDGVFVVAAKDGVVAVSSSSDGKSFGAPVAVATVEKLMCGMRRGPRLAATAKALVVTAISAESGDLAAWRSLDRGATWVGPVRVNGQARSAREGLDGLAAGPKGELAACWLDDRKGGKEVWAAVSKDDGASWKEGLVYSSPDGHVCECCHPSVAWNEKGELAVMFRNWLDGARDFYLAISKDAGKKWSPAEKLGDRTWKVNMCPMDGGAVVGTKKGFAAAWRADSDVSLARVGGEAWLGIVGRGKQPWLADGPRGPFVLWLDGTTLEMFEARPAPGGKRRMNVEAIAQGASDPCVASALGGKGPVVAVWQQEDGVFAKVLARD